MTDIGRSARAVTTDGVDVAIDDFADMVFREGWTDGFPVFPPLKTKVDEVVDYLGRDRDEPVATIIPGDRTATVEAIAVNCVMAGCKPQYVPVVIAAVEAMTDPTCHLLSAQTSTVGGPPLIIVSGPVVKDLGFNYAEGALAGCGTRANGTIARAVRLILWNIGQGKPGFLSKTVFGRDRWGTLICERPPDDGNPWSWLHESTAGLAATDSAVTALDAWGQYLMTNWVRAGAPMEQNVAALAQKIAEGLNASVGGGTRILVLNPDAAKMVADAGWDKERLRDAIYAEMYTTVGKLKAGLAGEGPDDIGATNTSKFNWRMRVDVTDDDARVYLLPDPSHLHIMVSGGWGGGHVSYLFIGGVHSMDGKGLVTKKIDGSWS